MVTGVPAVLRSIVPPETSLSVADATAILQIAFLAAEVNFDEDPNELALLGAFSREIWTLAGVAPRRVPPVSPLPIDAEERIAWIRRLSSQLTHDRARELAYVVADLVTMSDLEMSPVETTLLDELRRTLGITDDRAATLVASAAELVTPGVSDM